MGLHYHLEQNHSLLAYDNQTTRNIWLAALSVALSLACKAEREIESSVAYEVFIIFLEVSQHYHSNISSVRASFESSPGLKESFELLVLKEVS